MEHAESGLAALHNSYYFWDVITLLCGMVCVFGGLAAFAWILGLPGRIAVARNHPEAEAVYTMGWVGFLAIVPWVNAFIWAFKPTEVVDVRRFPDEEAEAIKRDIARLKKRAYGIDDDDQDAEGVADADPSGDVSGSPDNREV
ncbi:MAG: DUF3302 domain-containing protein [Pseudomonadota bacterium]